MLADGRLVPYEELAERATILHGDGFVPSPTADKAGLPRPGHGRVPVDDDRPYLACLRPGAFVEQLAQVVDALIGQP